jgi:hypothetical protein
MLILKLPCHLVHLTLGWGRTNVAGGDLCKIPHCIYSFSGNRVMGRRKKDACVKI